MSTGTAAPTELLPLVVMYANGASLKEVAEAFDLTPKVVTNRLRKAGLNIRTKANYGEKNGRWKGGEANKAAGNQRATRIYGELFPCEICETRQRIVRHHRDENPHNNEPSNIAYLCQTCHSWHHVRAHYAERRCSGCRCEYDSNTPGCETCYKRHFFRAKNKAVARV